MIKINNIVGPSRQQVDFVMRAMRNPLNSWNNGDTIDGIIGDADMKLATKLIKAGPDHGKFLRMLPLHMDITAPLYWWKEFDTYKVGTVSNSCSTMHTLTDRPLSLDDFEIDGVESGGVLIEPFEKLMEYLNILMEAYKAESNTNVKNMYWRELIQLLPSSYQQKRSISMNYQVARNIRSQRANHKLFEWQYLCLILETIPYSELITC